MLNKQTGFTMLELIYTVIILAALSICGLSAYVAIHFIIKFW